MINLLEEPEIVYNLKENFYTETYYIDSHNIIFNLNKIELHLPNFKLRLLKDQNNNIQEIFLIFELIPPKYVLKISAATGIEEEQKHKIESIIQKSVVSNKPHNITLLLRIKNDLALEKIKTLMNSDSKPKSIFHVNDEEENSIILNLSNYEIYELFF